MASLIVRLNIVTSSKFWIFCQIYWQEVCRVWRARPVPARATATTVRGCFYLAAVCCASLTGAKQWSLPLQVGMIEAGSVLKPQLSAMRCTIIRGIEPADCDASRSSSGPVEKQLGLLPPHASIYCGHEAKEIF